MDKKIRKYPEKLKGKIPPDDGKMVTCRNTEEIPCSGKPHKRIKGRCQL